MRLFVAVDLSPEVRETVARALPQAPGIRWIKPENYHLTLKFLGSVPRARLPEVEGAIARACVGASSFEIGARGAGAFPSEASAKVLWVGIDDPSRGLAGLAARLEEEFEKLGFPREKRTFSPHLTIARVDRLKARELLAPLREREFGRCAIREVWLYESQTLPSGAVYAPKGAPYLLV